MTAKITAQDGEINIKAVMIAKLKNSKNVFIF